MVREVQHDLSTRCRLQTETGQNWADLVKLDMLVPETLQLVLLMSCAEL